jgi:hypothetical protein
VHVACAIPYEPAWDLLTLSASIWSQESFRDQRSLGHAALHTALRSRTADNATSSQFLQHLRYVLDGTSIVVRFFHFHRAASGTHKESCPCGHIASSMSTPLPCCEPEWAGQN